MANPKDETYSHKETVERREAALKRMLATPPTPHKPLGLRHAKKRKPSKLGESK